MVELDTKQKALQETRMVGKIKKSYLKCGYIYAIHDSCGGCLTVEVIEQVPLEPLHRETHLRRMWTGLTDFVYGLWQPDTYGYRDERSDFQQLRIRYNPPSGFEGNGGAATLFGSNRRSVTRGHAFSRREYIPLPTRALSNGKIVEVPPMAWCHFRKRQSRRVESVATCKGYLYFVRHLLKELPDDVQHMFCPRFIDCPKDARSRLSNYHPETRNP